MAATESVMLSLGTHAPDFALPDAASGETIHLANFAGKRALITGGDSGIGRTADPLLLSFADRRCAEADTPLPH